jgi:hypothetical protein
MVVVLGFPYRATTKAKREAKRELDFIAVDDSKFCEGRQRQARSTQI